VATEQAAARDRVLAARAEVDEELKILEASTRAAVDIPAKIKRNPARAVAVVGGVGFLALRGPQRIVRGTRRAIFGARKPMPKSLLPDEVEKTLRSFGDDGEQVRAALERDFALYATKAKRQRLNLRTVITVALLRPLLLATSKRITTSLFSPDPGDFASRLANIRARALGGPDQANEVLAGTDDPAVGAEPPATI
jgi:hypothetical protein